MAKQERAIEYNKPAGWSWIPIGEVNCPECDSEKYFMESHGVDLATGGKDILVYYCANEDCDEWSVDNC
tara:strand:- start:104 stop:310 length:207 start_codon:yes stop_codon:yes gene_type:complete